MPITMYEDAGLRHPVPVQPFFREAGYDGWLSLEFEGSADPITIGVPRSLAAARKLL